MAEKREKSFVAKWLNMEKSSKWVLIWIAIFTLAAWLYMALSGDGMAGMNMDMNAGEDAAMQSAMAARAERHRRYFSSVAGDVCADVVCHVCGDDAALRRIHDPVHG